MKQYLLSLFILCSSLMLNAQERTIMGRVTAFNIYGLPGVEVSAKKAKTKVLTKADGSFQISSKRKDVLKFHAPGFRTQVLKPIDSNMLNVNLIYSDNSTAMKQVVEGGYMSQEDLEYAIENLMQENNDYSRYQNIFELIQAVAPLAKVVNSDGFSRVFLTSKGPNTISAGSYALIVVDGVVTENISGIQPVQVAKINVLTGTETSLYGTRGGNGVIEIFLKH